MDNTLPNGMIRDTQKKVYTAPQLVEHGILSEVTNSGVQEGPADGVFIASSGGV